MKYATILFAFAISFGFSSCNTNEDPESSGPNLVFKFKFDSNQVRYDSFGNVATIPSGNAALSPTYHGISGHYVELIQGAWIALGAGEIIYQGEETTIGGANAVDFSKASIVAENEVFFSIPLSEVAAGTYEYVRVSVTYQNYDIRYNALGFNNLTGRLASFVGFNTYISSYTVGQMDDVVNDDKLQGYWAFESQGTMTRGQAPAGATTVVNPLFASIPIPQGSCLVTGAFEAPLVLNGDETEDVTVMLSVSTNQSFEWTDGDGNGQYDPLDGDVPVDMGLRGLKAIVQ